MRGLTSTRRRLPWWAGASSRSGTGTSDELNTWDYGDWHHAVMGVDLLTDRGPSCVLWTSTFHPYGVEVFPTPGRSTSWTANPGPSPGTPAGLTAGVPDSTRLWRASRRSESTSPSARDISATSGFQTRMRLTSRSPCGSTLLLAGLDGRRQPAVPRDAGCLRGRRRDHGRVHGRTHAADRVPRFRVPGRQVMARNDTAVIGKIANLDTAHQERHERTALSGAEVASRDQQPPGPRRGLVRRSWWRWLSSSPPPCPTRFESRARG